MRLQQLQRLLEAIYDVPEAQAVDEFVFSDRTLLPLEVRASASDEQVLVAESAGEAVIGVYLDDAVLQRLALADPVQSLHAGNIADFWTALEGVSHFLYLSWNMRHDRPVSLLDLELQAEIDKYVGSLWLLRAQHPGHFPDELHPLLFRRARVDATLAGERAGLYHRANRYAARFCRELEQRLRERRANVRRSVIGELRRFYRWSPGRKCRHIEQLAH